MEWILGGVERVNDGCRDTDWRRNLFHGPGDSDPIMGDGSGVMVVKDPAIGEYGVTESFGESESPYDADLVIIPTAGLCCAMGSAGSFCGEETESSGGGWRVDGVGRFVVCKRRLGDWVAGEGAVVIVDGSGI